METIYCLVPETYWLQYEGKQEYESRTYAQEGFIHATKGDELLVKVANRVYSQFTEELLVLVVDESRITAKLLYEEASDGLLYPHIYGPLNTDAIVEVKRLVRDAKGNWQFAGSK